MRHLLTEDRAANFGLGPNMIDSNSDDYKATLVPEFVERLKDQCSTIRLPPMVSKFAIRVMVYLEAFSPNVVQKEGCLERFVTLVISFVFGTFGSWASLSLFLGP